jgi:hypothetical protein
MLCASARLVVLLGLRPPELREQLQRPLRAHLCDGGVIKADTARARRAGAGAGAPASLLDRLLLQRAACAAAMCWFPEAVVHMWRRSPEWN